MLWLLLTLFFIACGGLAVIAWVALTPAKCNLAKDGGHKPVPKILPAPDESDPDRTLVWRTQIPALELMDQFSSQPALRGALRKFYRDSSHHYPELYENTCFGDWLNWLEQAKLIVQHEGEPRLTNRGREFLNHLLGSRRAL